MEHMKKKAGTAELWSLIHSLTPHEKRYWKLYTRHTGKTNAKSHVQLFELLASQESFNEEELAKSFSRNENLSVIKHYLLRDILRSMRLFHEETSVDIRIRELMTNSEFLFEKRAYGLSLAELNKAKQLAIRFERYPVLFEILFFEIELSSTHVLKNVAGVIDNLYNETQTYLEVFRSDFLYKRVRDEAFLKMRLKRTELKESAPDAPEIDPPLDTRLLPCLYYWGTVAFRAMHASDWKKAESAHQKMLEKWDEDPERIKEDSKPFKRFLANYLNVAHACGDFAAIPDLIERIRSIPARSPEEAAEEFQNIAYIELLVLMNNDGFHKIDMQVERIEQGLKLYAPKIHKARQIAFFYNIAIAYFLMHEWKKSLHWVEQVINQSKHEHRQDLQNAARILRLIIWYELDKIDLLEYELVSVERYLRKHKSWYAYESAVVKLFDKISYVSESERASCLESFKARVKQTMNGKNSASLPGSSELMFWLNSQITGKNMRQLLAEDSLSS